MNARALRKAQSLANEDHQPRCQDTPQELETGKADLLQRSHSTFGHDQRCHIASLSLRKAKIDSRPIRLGRRVSEGVQLDLTRSSPPTLRVGPWYSQLLQHTETSAPLKEHFTTLIRERLVPIQAKTPDLLEEALCLNQSRSSEP